MIAALAALVASGWSKIAGYIAAAVALAAAIAAAFLEARHIGVQAQENADLRQGAKDHAKADKAAEGVAALGDDAVAARLRRDFSRS